MYITYIYIYTIIIYYYYCYYYYYVIITIIITHIYLYYITYIYIYISYIIWGITHLQSGMHPQVGLLRPPDLALGSRGKSFLKLSVNEPETLNQIYPLVN